jgi:hypothetical protein
MRSYSRLLMGVSIITLILSACRVVIDTKINPDGSGVLRNAVVYSAEEQQNFEQTPGNESASICDDLLSDMPAGATFSEEQYGGEIYCVTTRSFADLQELRQLYAQMDSVSVRELQFELGRLTVDIDVDLTQDGETQKIAQEWRLTLPGTIETHNADRVDSQTLIWAVPPGQRVKLHAETRVGVRLQTLGPTGMVVLASGIGCLVIALGAGAFYRSRRRQRAAA